MENEQLCIKLSKKLKEIENSNRNLLLHNARAKVVNNEIDISYVSWQKDNTVLNNKQAQTYLDYLESLESTREFKPHYFIL